MELCIRGKKWNYAFLIKCITPFLYKMHNSMHNSMPKFGIMHGIMHFEMHNSAIIPMQMHRNAQFRHNSMHKSTKMHNSVIISS